MEKRFLADIIGEEYQRWYYGDVAFLSTPTGSGKTTFALHIYAAYIVAQGGKVLLLEPRKILVQQIKDECRQLFGKHADEYELLVRGITVWTYQELEETLRRGGHIPDFDAIIADEVHYFLTDSIFNPDTAVSYAYLLWQTTKKQAVVVLISATIEKIREVFLRDAPHSMGTVSFLTTAKLVFSTNTAYDYVLEPDYSYLNVKYVNNDNEMIEIAANHRGKILWFCSSKKRGEKILAKLQEGGDSVAMITAENKEGDAAPIVKSLARNRKFSQKILLATSVLDVGVSITDPEVNTVVLDAYDKETFLQMLGRVRMTEEGQKMNVYIFSRTAENYQNLLERKIIPQLDFIEKIVRAKEEFRPAKIVELMSGQPFAPSVYTQETEILTNRLTTLRLNELYLSYLDFEEGLQTDPAYAIKKQLEWLGLQDTFSVDNYVNVEVKEIKKEKLYQLIKEKGGEAMAGGVSKGEIAQFLEEIKLEIRNLNPSYVRSNTSLSVNKFNEICENEGLPFYIAQEEVEKKQKYSLIFKKDVVA